jgi:hypothetical protein
VPGKVAAAQDSTGNINVDADRLEIFDVRRNSAVFGPSRNPLDRSRRLLGQQGAALAGIGAAATGALGLIPLLPRPRSPRHGRPSSILLLKKDKEYHHDAFRTSFYLWLLSAT